MMGISCAEMKAMDDYAINQLGIPGILLMENAALKVIDTFDLSNNYSFTIVCGPGNNGGDGLAIARHLHLKEKSVDLFIMGDIEKVSPEFDTNLTILKNMQIEYTHLTDTSHVKKLIQSLKKNQWTIDALFGIGLDRRVEGLFKQVIDQLNKHSQKTLSLDIPSGLSGDNGDVLGISVKADQTICFHEMKQGLINKENYTGETIVVDIGIPKWVTEKILTGL